MADKVWSNDELDELYKLDKDALHARDVARDAQKYASDMEASAEYRKSTKCWWGWGPSGVKDAVFAAKRAREEASKTNEAALAARSKWCKRVQQMKEAVT